MNAAGLAAILVALLALVGSSLSVYQNRKAHDRDVTLSEVQLIVNTLKEDNKELRLRVTVLETERERDKRRIWELEHPNGSGR